MSGGAGGGGAGGPGASAVGGGAWPFDPPITPMEARVADSLPSPPGWAYEPKWDGFRAVAWSGPGPRLDSRNRRPLLRYFPELEPALLQLPPGAVVDAEVVVVRGGRLDFDALQNRIHPAESRVAMLARETPARLAVFDLLGFEGHDLRPVPFRDRRRLLVELAAALGEPWDLTPSTEDRVLAERWFREFEAAGFDGIVAKRLDQPYREGERAMVKVKHRRSVDAVVGGYRLRRDAGGAVSGAAAGGAAAGPGAVSDGEMGMPAAGGLAGRVGSLLLGLYTSREPGAELHFIGHTSDFGEEEARGLLERLEPLRLPEGESAFGEDVRHPGAVSRWTGDKDPAFISVRPELVVQISYDQLTGDRFRHATRIERWRPDKDPRDCTMDQLERPSGLTVDGVVRRAG